MSGRFYSGARIRLCGATCFKSSVAISCGLSVVACNIKPVQLLFLVTASCKSAGCTANTERRQSAPELGAKLSTSFLINRGQPFPNSDFKRFILIDKGFKVQKCEGTIDDNAAGA